MPERSYWRAQVSAFIEQQMPLARSDFIINDAAPETHPTDARLVVRTRDTAPARHRAIRMLAHRLRRCGFVVWATNDTDATIIVADRDRLVHSYSPDHEGIIAEAEPAVANGGDR